MGRLDSEYWSICYARQCLSHHCFASSGRAKKQDILRGPPPEAFGIFQISLDKPTFLLCIFLSDYVFKACLLYTSDAADDLTRVDLGGRRIIKKKKKKYHKIYI